MKTKVDIFLPHDVREVVLIPFFLQFSGFREDDILLEGVGEDNTRRRPGAVPSENHAVPSAQNRQK